MLSTLPQAASRAAREIADRNFFIVFFELVILTLIILNCGDAGANERGASASNCVTINRRQTLTCTAKKFMVAAIGTQCSCSAKVIRKL